MMGMVVDHIELEHLKLNYNMDHKKPSKIKIPPTNFRGNDSVRRPFLENSQKQFKTNNRIGEKLKFGLT